MPSTRKLLFSFPSLQEFRNGLPNETKQDRGSLEIDFITFRLIFFSNRIFRSGFIKTRPTFPFRPRLPRPFNKVLSFDFERFTWIERDRLSSLRAPVHNIATV